MIWKAYGLLITGKGASAIKSPFMYRGRIFRRQLLSLLLKLVFWGQVSSRGLEGIALLPIDKPIRPDAESGSSSFKFEFASGQSKFRSVFRHSRRVLNCLLIILANKSSKITTTKPTRVTPLLFAHGSPVFLADVKVPGEAEVIPFG